MKAYEPIVQCDAHENPLLKEVSPLADDVNVEWLVGVVAQAAREALMYLTKFAIEIQDDIVGNIGKVYVDGVNEVANDLSLAGNSVKFD